MINAHTSHGCAVFNSNLHDGREVLLVAGGLYQDTTEVWDYQTPGSSWTSSKWEFCVFTWHFSTNRGKVYLFQVVPFRQ